MTEQIEEPSVTAYIEAYATDDYSDGPLYATVAATESLIEDLVMLKQVCKIYGLSEARILCACNWMPGNVEGELRLIGDDELVVTGDDFWFRATPKYGPGHIETRAQGIKDFIDAVRECAPGDTPRFGYYNDAEWAEVIAEAEEEDSDD